jgi:acetyl-CoA carboxylase beta subunit
MIDAIVTRNQMRESLINYLDYLTAGKPKPKAKPASRKKAS